MDSKDESEYVYYNIRIDNETSNGRAFFNETRVQPILDNPSNYELAVERFYVPAMDIPIMIFKDNYYYVTLSFGGVDATVPLVWIPNTSGTDPYGNSIWNYQEMVDIVNVAFQTAFTTLGAGPPTEAPYITYEAESNLFVFNAQRLYDPVFAGGATIEIFMNINLYSLFNSFQDFESEENDPKAHKILVKNNGNNISPTLTDYYSTYGEWVTLFNWNDLQSIVFDSNTIPVVPENLQSQTNETQKIITDFEPIQDINNRSAFQYYPQGPLRWYSLSSQQPLYNMNLNVYWKDNEGKLYDIIIEPTEVLTVKILFRKKI
jgi:hypothetical protein